MLADLIYSLVLVFSPVFTEMASKGKMGYKCRIASVLLLLLTSIAALIAVTVIQSKWRLSQPILQYGIVIDSGSSRSNIYVYKWPGDKQNETGVVTEKSNCRVPGDGISAMGIDPNKDKESWEGFKKCMTNVSAEIPPEKHNSTSLFLGATAGMRLLQEQDPQRAAEVLESLRKYLQSLPFDFKNASIITGQEEGLYGWITVNYLLGNFLEKNTWNTYIRPHGSKTMGSMDLGGASTQIAFAAEDELMGPDYMHIKLDHLTMSTLPTPATRWTMSPCYPAPCSFNKVEQPPVTGEFSAYAGYFFIARALLMNNDTYDVRPSEYDEFYNKTNQLCSTPWSELRKEKHWIGIKHLRTYCFASHYIFTLMAKGYKFDRDTWRNIHFINKVKNTSVGWSLGYMLSSSNMIPSEMEEVPPLTNPVFAGLVFLFSALTIVTVIFIFIILIRMCY
ncbi:ectonucleoside triphosphate diphosphohydrolase 3 isoform X3 [Nerophis lumbriciformis]|uniref:ectonucleoside triphosphate diphosphohydrolase 3 isoform X3 n=1 Tax=Nerophis lumbriciformis TaxID=546530 RepID=UPI002ADF5DD3|nr:ectonucleoside triphosphate diphosphohydrolase 3-like isoform X3 [Nerophis lumbriciformis]